MSERPIDSALNETKRLMPLVKAHFVGEQGGIRSTVVGEPDRMDQTVVGVEQSIEPAYDPRVLAMIYENSSALRPNVDAYITNIDSFGHAFLPVIETTAVDADEKIRDALRVERARAKSDGRNAINVDVLTASDEPSDKEVKERKELLEKQIRTERQLLGAFFDNCTYDMPFSGPEGLRGLTRQDLEVTGSGYWEVLRNGFGEICQFNYVPAVSVRLMPIDRDVTEVEVERRVSLLTSEKTTVIKRYRRYVQTRGDLNLLNPSDGNRVYFKEFGDPRIVSSRTGKVYKDIEAMRAVEEEKNSPLATEILPFKISSPRGSYGVPRWIGTLISVLGTRQAEEVNLLYFENRSVPPMAILVSGGRLNDNTVERLESYIANEIKGKNNFHNIMILEAEGSDSVPGQNNTSHMRIEIKSLTDSQQKDGLFQAYDERNADKVGQSFRLPRILRGDVRDFNRSTAEASIHFAETQVFGPIRQQFDWVVNTLIFPALGVKYHTFRSNAPTVRDPEALSKMIALLTSASILTPAEARDLAQDVFNRAFDNLTDEWTKKPLAYGLAEMNAKGKEDALEDFKESGGMSAPNAGSAQRQTGVQQAPPKTTPNDRTKPKPKSNDALRAQAKGILAMQKALLDADLGEAGMGMETDDDGVQRVVIRVPKEEWNTWWKKPT